MAEVWRPDWTVPAEIEALETDRYTITVTPSSAGIVVEIYGHRAHGSFGRGMADRFDLALAGALTMAAYTERLAQESTNASTEGA